MADDYARDSSLSYDQTLQGPACMELAQQELQMQAVVLNDVHLTSSADNRDEKTPVLAAPDAGNCCKALIRQTMSHRRDLRSRHRARLARLATVNQMH